MSDVNNSLRELIYTTPGGVQYPMSYETLERSGSRKLGVHELPNRNFPIIQDLGNNADRFPLTAYFHGADYMTRVDAFILALKDPGRGTLQHPRYGNVVVYPVSFTQSEDMVDKVGRAQVTVEFLRVAPIDPVVSASSASSSAAATSAAAVAAATETAIEPANASDQAAIVEDTASFIDDYNRFMADILALSESAQAEAARIASEILSAGDSILDDPVQLYSSLASLAALPAQIATNVTAKVESYRALIVETAARVPETYAQAANQFVVLCAAFGGACVAPGAGGYTSRADAVAASDSLDSSAAAYSAAVSAIDALALGYRPDPGVISGLMMASASARSAIIDGVFELRAERRIELANDRTPIDFYWEVAGTLDGIDEFIKSNGLAGDEILMMPRGKVLVIYG